MKTRFIYNDTCQVPHSVVNIIGSSSFGNVIYNKKTLCERAMSAARNAGITDCICIDNFDQLEALQLEIHLDSESTVYINMLSSAVATDEDAFVLALRKLSMAKTTCALTHNSPQLICCNSPAVFKLYLEQLKRKKEILVEEIFENIVLIGPTDFIMDISTIDTFLKFFSGSFSVRHFNHISGNTNEIHKESIDKIKIKNEHDFYYLLPHQMQTWFVQPYGYREDKEKASYTMERLQIPDASLLWIHQAFDKKQLRTFLNKIMCFISARPQRTCSVERSQNTTQSLFMAKITSRFEQLKKKDGFSQIDALISIGTHFSGLSAVIDRYQRLFNANTAALSVRQEVIGHGDLCFSNMLYDKDMGLLKLIDPKGSQTQGDLWTHPYYDIAKVSHSVLGLYDYINHGLFEIVVDEQNMLQIEFISPEMGWQRDMFLELLQERHYDPFLCRLCEASLFLSMLPLHMDYPRKVLGFILIAIHILEELEKHAKI